MRLGIIEFGTPLAEVPAVLSALRANGIDIITKLAEPPPSVRDEAERLHRAECDGILLTLGDGVAPDDVAEAMLFLHCPVLLVGAFPEVEVGRDLKAEAHAIVLKLAVACDQLEPEEAQTEWIEAWLNESAKVNRQKGVEAAHKLYGVRLIDVQDRHSDDSFALKMRWLHQFGILIRHKRESGDVRTDDLLASDGDILGALTGSLLRLVSGSDTVTGIDRSQLENDDGHADPATHTIALVSTYPIRHGGPGESAWNFSARILRGAQTPEGRFRIGRYAAGFLEADKDERKVRFYAVAGDHVGSLRAALNTLDIPTVVLR